MTPVLALRDVTVRYPSGVIGCRNISFELYPGDVLGIVGESGSGKSTVLACANLDITPSAGTVELLGLDASAVQGAERRKLRAQSLGIVYQTPQQGLDLNVTAGGNVAERMFGAGERSYGPARQRALTLHAAMELPVERFDVAVRTFSGGMRQRVQLAKALATSPPALLLDEPTSGLDVSVQAKTLDLIRRVQREHGLATVIVSHDLAVIRMLADRLLVMRGGQIVERGLTDQILDDPQEPYSQLLVASQLT